MAVRIGIITLKNQAIMTRSELAKDMIAKLSSYLLAKNIVNQDTFDNIDDNISMDKYEDAAACIEHIEHYKKIVEFLKERLEVEDEINVTESVRLMEVPAKDQKKLANFCYRSSTLSVLPNVYLKYYLDTDGLQDNNIMAIVEDILFKYQASDDDLERFWDSCSGNHNDSIYFITSKPDDQRWNLYAYAYLCYVNEARFDRPPVLNFHGGQKFAPQIQYNDNNKYYQYFDVFGVMSESKFSDDILSRYLKLYQIIEYAAFRKVLADLTKGNLKENGFVRQVLSVVKSGSNNEYSEISKGLKAIFSNPQLNAIIPNTDYTPHQKDFLKDKLKINIYSDYNVDQICKIIYQLRNCIVHNKESELHFAYYNVDDYREAIGIMRTFIDKLEPAIVDIINTPNHTVLEYDKDVIDLF